MNRDISKDKTFEGGVVKACDVDAAIEFFRGFMHNEFFELDRQENIVEIHQASREQRKDEEDD